MSDSLFACKPCSGCDPTKDTVKIDASKLLLQSSLLNKENLAPRPNAEKADMERKLDAEKLHFEEEDQLRVEREAEERRKEAEEEAAILAEMRAGEEEERKRRMEEAEERAQREQAQAAAFAKAEKQRATWEAEEGCRVEGWTPHAAPTRRSEAADAVAEREKEEKRQASIKVDKWCRNNGYVNMNTAKKTFKGNTKFPLHTAAKYSNVEIVELMVLLGVNKDAKNSKGESPLELVEKMAECEARDNMLAALQ